MWSAAVVLAYRWGLVVVIAAVVGGVVGSRSKGKAAVQSTASETPTATNTSFPDATVTLPSNSYFNNSVLYSIITDTEGKNPTQLKFEGAKAHNRTPDDDVFLGGV